MPHARSFHMALWCFFSIGILTSCTSLPISGTLPPGIMIEHTATIPADSPFAPDPAGTRVALVHNGLALLTMATHERAMVSPDSPQSIAWAPDGRRLAAAFLSERSSRIRIFDTGGNMLGSHDIAGKVNTLIWRDKDELLIAATEVKAFSFGVNFAQVFYRWEIDKHPVRIELQNSTLRTKVNQTFLSNLYLLFTFALSPHGDAIVYTRLHDPPLMPPALHYVLRNLATGSEREVATATLNAGGAVFTGSDDFILYGNGESQTMVRDPWYERNLVAFPYPGHSLSASGGGKTLLIDGNLLQDGRLLFSFPADATGSFTANGSLLFVRQGDRLLFVSGLPPDPAFSVPAGDRTRFLTLRQWRSSGLITPADFTTASERREKP